MQRALNWVIVLTAGLLCSCTKAPEIDPKWSSPVELDRTEDSLGNSPLLLKYHGQPILVKRGISETGRGAYVLNDDSNTWIKTNLAILTGIETGSVNLEYLPNKQLDDPDSFAEKPPGLGMIPLSKTTGYAYCFFYGRTRKQFESRRKPFSDAKWEKWETLSRTFEEGSYLKYVSIGEEQTVHVCWIDNRHEKRRLNPMYPDRGNYEVVYRYRQDSDPQWAAEKILSQGLLYSFDPDMAVEGQRVVVVWAGVQNAADGHSSYSENNIYFVTSKDCGKTWTKPLRVTDNVPSGVTAGEPKVALRDGIIHLVYVQGKKQSNAISPGMRLLNQPPWPILYQQRPFPD